MSIIISNGLKNSLKENNLLTQSLHLFNNYENNKKIKPNRKINTENDIKIYLKIKSFILVCITNKNNEDANTKTPTALCIR